MSIFGGGIDASTVQRVLNNQDRIERKLDALLAAFDIKVEPRLATPRSALGLDPDTRAAIEAAMGRGDKIQAIKLLREATGLGLAESKQAVETKTY